MDYPNVQRGQAYGLAIAEKQIPACKWLILACQRHFSDLDQSLTDPDFPYYFDELEAEKRILLAQLFPHVKGKWAREGRLIYLEDWQCFLLSLMFGWKKKDTGFRRYIEFYFKLPRKNGKTLIAAVICHQMAWMDNEYSAEVYCGASTEDQAWEVFSPVKKMAEKMPELLEEFNIEIFAKVLVNNIDGSIIRPVIGNPGDGSSPSTAVLDELHEQKSDDLYSTMETGMQAREQPVLLMITTAGDDITSFCYGKEIECQNILTNPHIDDFILPIIYGIDDSDDWKDPSVLAKANPNLGVSIDRKRLEIKQQSAIKNTARQNRFKTKHLNVWVQAGVQWVNMEFWKRCGSNELTLEQFHDCQCWICLDLASKIDICAMVILFKKVIDEKIHYYVFCRFYFPKDNIGNDDNNKEAYSRWASQGYLTLTEGSEISFDEIEQDLLNTAKDLDVVEVPHDKWRATQLAQRISGYYLPVEIDQGYSMTGGMRELEAAVNSGRLHHDNNPVLEWMAGNLLAKEFKGYVSPMKDKAKPHKKIDGMVALLMGLGRAMLDHDEGYT